MRGKLTSTLRSNRVVTTVALISATHSVWIMIQAANVAVRYDDRLKWFYQNAKTRHGGNHPIAITHVANKMVRIIWKMLTAKEPYESRNADRYARKLKRMKKVLQ